MGLKDTFLYFRDSRDGDISFIFPLLTSCHSISMMDLYVIITSSWRPEDMTTTSIGLGNRGSWKCANIFFQIVIFTDVKLFVCFNLFHSGRGGSQRTQTRRKYNHTGCRGTTQCKRLFYVYSLLLKNRWCNPKTELQLPIMVFEEIALRWNKNTMYSFAYDPALDGQIPHFGLAAIFEEFLKSIENLSC